PWALAGGFAFIAVVAMAWPHSTPPPSLNETTTFVAAKLAGVGSNEAQSGDSSGAIVTENMDEPASATPKPKVTPGDKSAAAARQAARCAESRCARRRRAEGGGRIVRSPRGNGRDVGSRLESRRVPQGGRSQGTGQGDRDVRAIGTRKGRCRRAANRRHQDG